MPQSATSDYTGRQIGSWRLERLLGTGSFGSVYLAKNPVIDREAAVKILHSHFTINPEIRRRFFDEARAASRARLAEDDDHPHPGVVQIFDGDDGSGSGGGLCYIVMERLSGTTLQEALAGGPLPALDTAQLGAALADTLAAVHRRGVIHRDLKPENIFLQQGDPRRPKILDFGIAKLREGGQGTVPGTVLGTALYMSPEQGQGLPDLDEHADLYSLGVILYECLTGRVPFAGDNYKQILWRHISEKVPDARALAPQTPEGLARLIEELMAKDMAARPSAAQARDRLKALAGGLARRTGPGRRPLPAVALAAGAAAVPLLLTVAAVAVLRGPPHSKTATPASPASASGEGRTPIPSTPAPAPAPPAPAPAPTPQAPAPLPAGFVSVDRAALAQAQVTIGDFHRFIDETRATRPGPDKWPWALSHPLPPHLPINNIPRDLAQRYCLWRHGQQGRLPLQRELLQGAAQIRRGPFGDMTTDQIPRGLLGFRCALNRPEMKND